MLHIAFKVAAELGNEYQQVLTNCEASVMNNVAEKVLERSMKLVFREI